jgi:hypothetical protein
VPSIYTEVPGYAGTSKTRAYLRKDKMQIPEGCKNSFQISFISDESLRPNPESKWLYEAQSENGETVTGVATTFDAAFENASVVFAR